MGILDGILKDLGLLSPKKASKKSKFIFPPDPREIKEKVEETIDSLKEIKNLPKEVMGRVVEAQEDFREADKAFRGAGSRKKRS